ncbi:DNA-directed RNA polymerase V subunit 7 [Zostera marina]|uniref:DNA-directed RNA polymerase subunit n=1 Tax=Zostera marina TaxID=29655 RepID=A0A0K9PNV5_ZOSMR|nr:DNA-directed RNA polymerase V subunit 7 [Zostera marina]
MFLKAKLSWNILITCENLNSNELTLHKTIILQLLNEFSTRRATEEHGYFIAVISLDKVGDGKVRTLTGDVLFPVDFTCITLKPFRGEVLDGVVDKVLKNGLFLKAGPLDSVFVPSKTIGKFQYVHGEIPIFLNEKMERLEKDTTVRFRVFGIQWKESDRCFRMLGTLDGGLLGPV